jgi:hypothetical protein
METKCFYSNRGLSTLLNLSYPYHNILFLNSCLLTSFKMTGQK